MRSPDPGNSPSVVIVYDDDCVFCSRSMSWIAAHDSARRVRFTACTSPEGGDLMRRHGVDPLDPNTFLVLIGDVPYVRSEAMLRLTKILDPSVRPFGLLRAVPTPIRDAVYGWTARNRRRIIRSDVCPVPSRDMIDRMLP